MQEIHRVFSQSITGSLSLHSLLTHLACVWLARYPSLSLHSRVREDCPEKKIVGFIAKNASLCYPFHPPGLKPLGQAWNQHPGISATTLLGGNPLGFEAPHWPDCLRPLAVKRKSFESFWHLYHTRLSLLAQIGEWITEMSHKKAKSDFGSFTSVSQGRERQRSKKFNLSALRATLQSWLYFTTCCSWLDIVFKQNLNHSILY